MKKLFTLITILFIPFLLVACSDSENNSTAEDEKEVASEPDGEDVDEAVGEENEDEAAGEANEDATAGEANEDETTPVHDSEEEASNQNELGQGDEEQLNNAEDYEVITKNEKYNSVDIDVKYPKFGIGKLDDYIANEAKMKFNHQIKLAEEMETENSEAPFTYYHDFSEPVITDEFISIVFHESEYMGGAHPNNYDIAVNYDLISNKIITINDVLQNDLSKLNALSEKTYDKLIEKGIVNPNDTWGQSAKESLAPEEENFSNFYLTEDSVTFIFNPYIVGPYAAGIIEIEFTKQEIMDL